MTTVDVTVSDCPPGCVPGGQWLSLADAGYSKYEVWSRGGQGRDQQPVRSIDRTTANGRQVKGVLLKVSEGSRERPSGPPRAKGYLRVKLYPDDGTPRPVEVHALIMLANVGRPGPGEQVRHLNSDPWNNRWEPGGEAETKAAGGNLIYGTPPENHADQVAAGTATRPETECVNYARCGGTVVSGGRRCVPCMTEVGEKAAPLLRQGMPRGDVAVELGYAATSGPYVEGLAISFGGYVKPSVQVRPKRTPRRTLRQRVAGWFRRSGGR